MPTNHVKPTPEELKAQEEEAIKAAEELEGRQQIPKEESAEAEAAAKAEAEKKESSEDEGDDLEENREVVEEEEEEQATPSKEKQAEIDRLKKENSASSREAQKIYAKNRVINQALVEAGELPDPIEEELIKEFTEWDIMSETEKTFAKETVISRNWRSKISQAKDQATKIEKWNESVEAFVDDPSVLNDNPELEGKTEEFKTFATEDSNNSVPFKILISAFLHEHGAAKKLNKGRMFERGSGGPNEKPELKDGSITLEEGRKLRETNYDKWKEMLNAGKIKSDL